ncbi:uncharacterized protein N7458_012490 [Penicillium daleae]|uniref:Uncharacterized protein n=1 Tax=Penicillium daleae TaxID=63821 RepID=A0AAD6FY40_9EURO|nr:uncharacterized protein N7458_012490 [Penicillium daleae]KAJ5433334.1 hypothetical protein N7458_012490 [Penicillium daleae]
MIAHVIPRDLVFPYRASTSVPIVVSLRVLPQRHKASNHSSSSTNAETLSARDKQSPTLTPTKTVAQADAELRERLERMSGDGGAAGIEYEDGKPSAMKRGVRNNMFRLI